MPAFALVGSEALQGDGEFTLTKMENGVRAEKTLPSGLRLVKEFQLGTNYLLTIIVRLENVTDQPVRLPAQEWLMGTATPISVSDNELQMAMEWYDGAKTQPISGTWFANRTLVASPGRRARSIAPVTVMSSGLPCTTGSSR